MCVKRFYVSILINIMIDLVRGGDKASFTELPGHRLISTHLETLVVANKIQCIRGCTKNMMCASVNYKAIGNAVECDLYSESMENRDRLIEDKGSTFSCEYVGFLTIKLNKIYPILRFWNVALP